MRLFRTTIALALLSAPLLATRVTAAPSPTGFTVPGTLRPKTGGPIVYENRFLLLPENHDNPHSRLIAVRYLRFPALNPAPRAEPLFFLPGGPGTLADEKFILGRPSMIAAIRRTIQSRDFVIVQQRGIRDGAYAASPYYELAPQSYDQPASVEADRARLRAGVSAALKDIAADGRIDLKGYEIPELVADVDAVREQLGASHIILYGGSFGSQWSFAYLKEHGDRVSRAVLTGIEPLDNGWDDPKTLWAAMGRIGGYVARDPGLAIAMPKGGLTALYAKVIAKLEAAPMTATVLDRATGEMVSVTVGPRDLQTIRYPISGARRLSVEAWPRFLLDIDRGDARYLAYLALRNRRAGDDSLLGEIIDGSMAISKKREAELDSHKQALAMIGDPNADYRAIRDLLPIDTVGDAYLAKYPISIPIVVMQGDVDMSTPLENAIEQGAFFPHGKVVTVHGATHDIKEEIVDPAVQGMAGPLADKALAFLNQDAGPLAPADMPDSVDLAPFHFVPADGPALYDRVLTAKAVATAS